MKIVFTLHDELNPDAGGMGVTAGLSSVYRGLGHEVACMSFADLPTALPFRAKALLFPEFVAARLRRSRVDVIDAAVGDAWLLGLLRRGVRHGTAPLLVARSHGLLHIADQMRRAEARRGALKLSWKYPLYWGGFRKWEVAISLRHADLCLFLNDHERAYAVEVLGLSDSKARVVDNGIPRFLLDRPFEPTPGPSSAFSIAHVGSYLPLKGVHYIASALDSVLGKHPEVRVSFLGTGRSPESVLSDFRREFRPRITVRQSYRREELPDLLRGHSVVISATLKEGFPLGLLEAMACGLAAVTAATPGPLQYVRDGENGLVVPQADSEALADALERLIRSPGLLDRLRLGAHATAQGYSWDRVGRDTLALYAEGLQRREAESSYSP